MKISLWERGNRYLLLLEYEGHENPDQCPTFEWCRAHGLFMNRFGGKRSGGPVRMAVSYQVNLTSDQAIEFKMRWI
jgi:hypothetical protein